MAKELHTKNLFILLYFLAKTLAFGYNFFHLDKVLATTNSEPELALGLVNAKILIEMFKTSKS